MKRLLLTATLILLGASLIDAPYLGNQALQHAGTVVVIAFLGIDMFRDRMSRGSFLCVTVFLWLHILGARYTYSFVPYDEWCTAMTGKPLSSWFGWHRNHYDRLVHLLFGALCMVPCVEFGQRRIGLSRSCALAFGVLVVLAASAFYEVFEWLLTVLMDPIHADAYNGQQGDMWDAQKDMAVAFVGSVGAMLVLMCEPSKPRGELRHQPTGSLNCFHGREPVRSSPD